MLQPKMRRDDKQKIKTYKKRFRVATIVILGKLWKTIKIRTESTITNFGSGNQLHVRKVLVPYNTCPNTVLLIKYTNECGFFNVYFPQK